VATPFPVDLPEDFQDMPMDGMEDSILNPDGYFSEENEEEQMPMEELPEGAFYANLAEDMGEDELERISTKILEGIQEDRESRSDWENTNNTVLKYIGFDVKEEKSTGFINLCMAYDSTLATALIRFFSVARAELFPSKGPVDCEILGIKTSEKEDQADRVKSFMNYYLTSVDKPYYRDSERLIMYTGFFGCAFRKVYQDPILKRPVARFVKPQDFIVNNFTVSLLDSTRMTQVVHLSRKEVLLRQLAGDFLDIKLPTISEDNEEEGASSQTNKTIKKQEGITTSNTENKSLFDFYETYIDMDLEGDSFSMPELDPDEDMEVEEGIPRPYIVTICATSKKIVSIRRNWKEQDQTFEKIKYFVHYYYLPGFGIYGLGLSHLIGSNAITLSSLLRQLINAGIYKNYPAGLKAKGMRVEDNDKALMPGEFRDIETGGMDINKVFMSMPYDEPSHVLNMLREKLVEQTQSLASTTEIQLSELSQNAPVGTTLAALESNTIVQSTILRTFHSALTEEFGLLYDRFAEHFTDEPYPFATAGSEQMIMRADFSQGLAIVPVSDPAVMTHMQRVMRAEAIKSLAMEAPDLFNRREIYKRVLEALNIADIDSFLLPDPGQIMPLDPVTENMSLIQGKPVQAALWQDHAAHIQTHAGLPQQSPQSQAHMQEHLAMKYLVEMQMAMGIQMPDEQQLQDPDVQNEIAMRAAEVTEQRMAAEQEEMQKNAPPDPNTVMMMDIEQRRESDVTKKEIAELRAEVDSYKAQLNFELEKYKLKIEQILAEEKHEADLEIAHLKQPKKEPAHERRD